ncbi:MAG: Mth938-like domain-containing protein [bacterium]
MAPVIEDYKFGSITIDGREYKEDVIILPAGVKPSWWRKEGHSLAPSDLSEVMKDKPETLIVGCGAYGAMKVPDSTRKWLADQGIEFHEMPSEEATRKYNELAGKKKVAAGFHLTC